MECEDGCGRQSTLDGNYCKICERSHRDVPKSLAENTAQVQRMASAGRSQQSQKSFGLAGGVPSLKIPEVHKAPAFVTNRIDQASKVVPFVIGVVIVLFASFVLVYAPKFYTQLQADVEQSAAAFANENHTKSTDSSSSASTSSEKSNSSNSPFVNKDKVWFSLSCNPCARTQYAASVKHLYLDVNEVGKVWANVEGVEDYYIKWDIKPFDELPDMMGWRSISFNEIEVWSSKSISFSAIVADEPGRNVIRAELYDRNDNLLEVEKLNVRVR